jgi:hypothetical protein
MKIHQAQSYADLGRQRLPHSEQALDSVLLLPLHGSLSAADQEYVVAQLRSLARAARPVWNTSWHGRVPRRVFNTHRQPA